MRQVVSTPGWPLAGFVTAGLLLLVLLFYRETSLYVMGLWNGRDGGTYTHGYLAMAISLYLVYRQRAILATLTPCPSFIGLFAVAVFGLLWLAALLMGVITVQIVVLLLLMISVIWAITGARVTRHLLFPLLIICFALPIWDPLPPILQEMTTDAVAWITRLVGMPALREGHLIILPAGRLAINESCSGMSYLLAALTLGMLYAFLNYRGFWPRVLIIMVAGIAAILANMVRVFIVVYAAYKTDMQHPLVGDHFSLGWYLFGGLVFILLLIDVKLHRHAGDSDTDVRQRDASAAAQPCIRSAMQYLLVLAAAVVLVAAGPAMAWWLEKQGEYPQDIVLKFPAGAGGWSGPSVTQDRWSPVYHGAITGKRAYRKGGQEVYLFVGHYSVQSQGKELVNVLNSVTNAKVWRPVYPQVRTARDGEQMFREQMLESTSGQRRLVWYWYRVGGRRTISDYRAKLLQLWGVLEGDRQATVIVIAADFDENADAARQALTEFLSATGQSLERVAVEQ